jgi:hypothetical protein
LTRLPRLLFVAALAALALSVSAAPASARKGPACWAAVINDWYDNGRMDHDYPVACYQQALQHLPPDVREYADAQDVIGRALTLAIARQGKNKQSGGQTDTTKRNVGPVGSSSGSSGSGGSGGSGSPTAPTSENGSGGKSLFAKAFDRLGPGNANSIPIPLIVLGSLALLLLAAGAAGMVARKLQERRLQPAPASRRTTPDGPAV